MLIPMLFIPILSIFSCSNKLSESNALESETTPVLNIFFENIKSGNFKKALPMLLSQNGNINLEDSSTVKLLNSFNSINEISGPFMGYSLLKSKAIGNDLAIYSYLVKYENKFYRFLFLFYNNNKQTKIYKFSFDDNIDLDLEESLKLYVN